MRTLPLLLIALPVMVQGAVTESPAQVIQAAKSAVEKQFKAYRAHIEAGQPRAAFKWDLSAQAKAVQSRLAHNPTGPLREALQVADLAYRVVDHQAVGTKDFDAVRAAVPATSEAWGILPSLLLKLTDSSDPKAAQAYVEEARAKSPVPAVRAHLLKLQLEDALEAKDTAAWQGALATLQRDHAGSQELLDSQKAVRLNQLTLVGLQAPGFSLAALDAPGQTYTLEGFKGKYLLIDFWATWCPDCRVELPGLSRAWGLFKDRNLEILSLSFDQKPEIVTAFRATPGNALPWHHAFIAGGWKHPLASTYGVVGIPKILLVGPDGKILATDGELRGTSLERTLDTLLPPVQKP